MHEVDTLSRELLYIPRRKTTVSLGRQSIYSGYGIIRRMFAGISGDVQHDPHNSRQTVHILSPKGYDGGKAEHYLQEEPEAVRDRKRREQDVLSAQRALAKVAYAGKSLSGRRMRVR